MHFKRGTKYRSSVASADCSYVSGRQAKYARRAAQSTAKRRAEEEGPSGYPEDGEEPAGWEPEPVSPEKVKPQSTTQAGAPLSGSETDNAISHPRRSRRSAKTGQVS